MAKKDKNGARIPKRIAGVKIPKEARQAGERLLDRAASPEGQKMIAQGIAMAATFAATAAARKAAASAASAAAAPVPPVPPTPPAPPAPPRPGEGGTSSVDPHQVANAIGQAADALLSQLFAGKRR